MTGSPESDPLVGTLIADRYRIERRLGQGGMGAVYLAEHIHMKKPFAVKVLHREMGMMSEAVFRFEREAVASGRVTHEHLVTATDFGQLADGSRYLVLEYIPGKSLSTLIAEGPLAAERALLIVRQIAAALAAIHAAGILHRDVKPDNVMLVERADGEDFVKLLDFGMAKVQQETSTQEPQVTRQGLVFGTPRYMAPEQAAGEPTDHRADLYSLGIILYAMLSGAPPFNADDIRDVLRAQRYELPPPLPPHIHPAVAALAMTLLAKDPNGRVQSATAVMEYVDTLLHRLGTEKSPATSKWGHFFRRPAGLALLVGLSVLVFGAAFAWVKATRQPKETATAPSASGAPVSRTDAALEAILVRAEVGDTDAWRKLEARSDPARSPREWFVLGAARMAHHDMPRGLEAYLRAAEADARYRAHPRVLRDLVLSVRTDAWEPALRVAAALPGTAGADILFDVWASTPRATPATQRARDLLASDAVRARASEAVRIAFDLRIAQGQSCESRAALVARAVTAADARSFRPLFLLTARNCGPRKNEDCFPCLRADDSVDRALERAKTHPGPDYTRVTAAE